MKFWAADAAPDLASLVQYGVLGLVVIALITGVLAPKWVVVRLEADALAWKTAYERERDAHAGTREANVELSRQAQAAIETARTATAILEKLDHPRSPRGARAS